VQRNFKKKQALSGIRTSGLSYQANFLVFNYLIGFDKKAGTKKLDKRVSGISGILFAYVQFQEIIVRFLDTGTIFDFLP
jgi:hypothetical protein